jgi:hypothetical protein
MITLLDHLDSRPAATTAGVTTTPAQRLRATTAAVRVSFAWMGTQKTLNPEQKARAAETFGAEGQYLSAGKKLPDRHGFWGWGRRYPPRDAEISRFCSQQSW